jgi:CRISPR-associated endonuclease/helicase Cas3
MYPEMSEESFRSFFKLATNGSDPLPYQKRLALHEPFPLLLDIPTGLGKTSAAILAWLWRRRFAGIEVRKATPRRLVYCLPMRVLVEQTHRVTIEWLNRIGLFTELAKEQHSDWSRPDGDIGIHPIAIHLLLGGEEKHDWALWPERDAILIGTQDMLISRALNRGYAAGRARWPLEFGLLNSDCLWIFDEIQIMDTGLATSLQLDAWRQSLQLRSSRDAFITANNKHLAKPCRSVWMSATMAKHWLERAVDWSPKAEVEWSDRQQLSHTEQSDSQLRSGQLFQIRKQLRPAPIAALERPKTKDGRVDKADSERKELEYLKRLAEHINQPDHHALLGLTLVIVNTVDRATKLFEILIRQNALNGIPIKLIHSRFRPFEREQWSVFLNQKVDSRRILISTQVVEAGVDLSASVLYTELAPWASLVQRFGRCARYPGDSGQVIWLDLDLGSDRQPVDHWAKPYDRSELVAAREKLRALEDVGLKSLTVIKEAIDLEKTAEQASRLFPYEPRFVPRDKDLFDLFDTTPDLTGADVDVSRYIREGEELDVQVFWRDLSNDEKPERKERPHRRELCTVPFHRFQEFAREALKQRHRIWRRRYSKGSKRSSGWELLEFDSVDQAVYPGQVFLLEKTCGGYSSKLGWTGDQRHTDFELPQLLASAKATVQDDDDDDESLSISKWLTVLEHTRHVCQKLNEILDPTGLTESEVKVLRLAARWHDRGKAHVAFTAKLSADLLSAANVQRKLGGQPPAKAPEDAWRRDSVNSNNSDGDQRRPGFRHELASALAILETLCFAKLPHEAFAWPDGLDKAQFVGGSSNGRGIVSVDDPLAQELSELSAVEIDLLVYLVASHHGKVRMSLRSSPDDELVDVPDPCPADKRQARGVRDGDALPSCELPAANLNATAIAAPAVTLSLDLMELGLSPRFGASWRERMQLLLEQFGPFQLAYLEAMLRAADCRGSAEEDQVVTPTEKGA